MNPSDKLQTPLHSNSAKCIPHTVRSLGFRLEGLELRPLNLKSSLAPMAVPAGGRWSRSVAAGSRSSDGRLKHLGGLDQEVLRMTNIGAQIITNIGRV